MTFARLVALILFIAPSCNNRFTDAPLHCQSSHPQLHLLYAHPLGEMSCRHYDVYEEIILPPSTLTPPEKPS